MVNEPNEEAADPRNDLIRKTFQADQADAAAQATSRDGVEWRMGVESAQADVTMKRAHARRDAAVAQLLEAIALAANLVVAGGVLVGLYLAVRIALGWFQ